MNGEERVIDNYKVMIDIRADQYYMDQARSIWVGILPRALLGLSDAQTFADGERRLSWSGMTAHVQGSEQLTAT